MQRFNWWAAVIVAVAAADVSTIALLSLPPIAHANIVSGLPLLRGMAPQFQLRSTFYYPVQGMGIGNTALSATLNNGVEFAQPFWVPATTTFTRLATFVTTGGSAGSLIRFGIYADSGGFPGNLLLDAGTVASTSSAAVAEATIAQSLTQGQYWISLVTQGAPVTPPTVPVSGFSTIGIGFDSNTELGNGGAGKFQHSGITGALANWTGATITTSTAVALAMKVQ